MKLDVLRGLKSESADRKGARRVESGTSSRRKSVSPEGKMESATSTVLVAKGRRVFHNDCAYALNGKASNMPIDRISLITIINKEKTLLFVSVSRR